MMVMLNLMQYKPVVLQGDMSIILDQPLELKVVAGTSADLRLTITKDVPLAVIVEQNANLNAHIIHKRSSSVDASVTLHKDAKAILTESFLDGSAQQKSKIDLVGTGASIRISQVIFGDDSDKIDVHTIAHHQVKDTTSQVDIRVLADGASQISAIGDIRIDRQAKNAVAHLTDHALILSKDARAHASPAMEVIADDVIASHAASTHRISPEQIFYLEQRGIDNAQAKQLIALGFAGSILGDSQFQDVVMDGLQQQWNKSKSRK